MRDTDFMEPIPPERTIPNEVKNTIRNQLLDAIEQDQAGTSLRGSERRARHRITVLAAVLLSLLGVGAAWALSQQPEQTTRIVCPGNDVIAAVSGDPVADCAEALRHLGIDPPEMEAFTNEAGAVIVQETGDDAADLQPLGEDFRQDTAIIELEASINDVTIGLEASCYTTEEAIPIVESAVNRVGLDWSIDVISEADGEARCAYGFPQPERSSVGLISIDAPLPSDEQPPDIELGRQLHNALEAECLNLDEAAAVVERLANELDMEEMMSSITQTTDDQATCTRATVTAGGAVFVNLRGPAG